MVIVPWGSIATFLYSRIWNFSTVLAENKFLGGNFLNLHTVDLCITEIISQFFAGAHLSSPILSYTYTVNTMG